MNKRGQFYLFAAIILILVVFAITAQPNKLEEKILLEDFNALSRNYANEAPKVVNDALKNDETVGDELEEFTNKFIDYAKTIDPNLGIVYVYKAPSGENVVSNLARETITIRGDKTGILFSAEDEAVNDITLDIGGKEFQKNVPTKMQYFEGATSISVENLKSIELGGVLYPFKRDNTLNFIVTSEDKGNHQKRVSITTQ